MTELDNTKKQAPVNLGRVLVLGLGTSGTVVSKYCANLLGSRVETLTIAAGKANEKAEAQAEELKQRGAQVAFDTYDFEQDYDLCIASPGISENSDFYKAAAAHAPEVISEVEFAWRESAADSTWVAITGTNGKTTTTALTAHLLQTCGKRAAAVGNIGDTCIDAVASGKVDYYVAEVSSYQLASTRNFKPNVAVLLNITPDHLKWHGSLEAYAQAKQKIYANCDKTCAVVMDATNDVVREYVRNLRALPAEERPFNYIPLGTAKGIHHSMIEACGSENAAFVNAEGKLTIAYAGTEHALLPASDLQISGEHNASNALAAAAAVVALGCEDAQIAQGLASFAPLEHRIEPCGSVNGVRCYNDSKATNVDATLKALAAFGEERPIVLLGGDDKGTDLTELVNESVAHCKAVVNFGDAGERFYQAFTNAETGSLQVLRANHLEDALDTALTAAQPGDIVVLSPACASFDEFSCFEERGEVFKRLVAQRAASEPTQQGGA